MHITVLCPQCQSRYQLDPSLQGKRMRCPNAICRAVFEVRAETTAPPTPSKSEIANENPAVTGGVGDVVPILQAEAVVPERKAEKTPVVVPDLPPVRKPPAKKVPPPVADAPGSPPTAPARVEKELPDDLGIPGDDEEAAPVAPDSRDKVPHELKAGNWEAPPVRAAPLRPAHTSIEKSRPTKATTTIPSTEPEVASAKKTRRRSLVLIFMMLFILGGVLGGGLYLLGGREAETEGLRMQKALELYKNQQFEEATAAFQKLLRDYPTGKNRRQYDFLVELSAVREAVYAPRPDIEERADAFKVVLQFLELYTNDPLLKDYHGDIWHTLQRLARELTSLAEQKHNADYLHRARRAWAEAGKFTPPPGARIDDVEKTLSADFTRVEDLLAARAARLQVLQILKGLASQGSADAVREGRLLAKNAKLEQDPEVIPLLDDLLMAHRAKVVFTPVLRPDKSATLQEDSLPSLYVSPRIGKVHPVKLAPEPRQSPVVFAQARGVLYALDVVRGDVRWVRRVGVDSTILPVRVPASPAGPELALVLSSDTRTVTAVQTATGAVVWQHALKDVCLGQPVLVDHHLLVPTLSGHVEEIEATQGTFQGFYSLGQPLVLGGVHQPGTTLVVFPADRHSVYVLDVARRQCVAILYTGHAPGSLRGLPLAWSEPKTETDPAKGDQPGWLLLSLASEGDGLQFRPYVLPIRQPDQAPLDIQIKVRGNAWSAPWHDHGKLAQATDNGLLAVYGIRQKGDRDPLLFPLVPQELRLQSEETARRARPLVVHADRDSYWVLSGGKLQRVEYSFTTEAGPSLRTAWPQPLDLGAPLHAGQAYTNDDGRTVLMLVTQEIDNPTCWARALDADEGKVLWQRQLGMVCAEVAVAAGGKVFSSGAGSLFGFDADALTEKTWTSAGTYFPFSEKESWLLAGKQGAVRLGYGQGTLRVQGIEGKEPGAVKTYPLPAPPQGTPVLAGDFVLVPLASGIVIRIPLGAGAAANGPDWRGVGVEETSAGYLVPLNDSEFILTDGGRGLQIIHWGDAKLWQKRGGVELSHRITAAPAVLGQRLLVADASDTVTLLEGERLQAVRRWTFGGKVTSGPFARGKGVGIIVSKNRLLWLDADKDQPLWEYTFVAPVIGQPELVDGLLVVADLQGNIVALDPADGRPAGTGYRLQSNQAPAATPVPFGAGRLFVPLMDGTVLLVPLEKLR